MTDNAEPPAALPPSEVSARQTSDLSFDLESYAARVYAANRALTVRLVHHLTVYGHW